jgi:hypothetical protein
VAKDSQHRPGSTDTSADAPWAVEDYTSQGGRSLVREFIESLTGRNKADAIALIELLGERGNSLRPPHSRSLGEGLFEMRGKAVLIFYLFRSNRRIVLLSGVVKRRRSIPLKVPVHARALQREVLARETEVS